MFTYSVCTLSRKVVGFMLIIALLDERGDSIFLFCFCFQSDDVCAAGKVSAASAGQAQKKMETQGRKRDG